MTININGHNYVLEYEEGLFVNEGQWGRINNVNLIIKIDKDLKDSVRGETILHEIHEAHNFWQDWKLDHHLLTQINTNVFGTLNNNKELVKTIFGE